MEVTVKPLVVIRCLAFNQEKYIRQCLEGFVSQETDFPFVAIVHDDASTDGTADVIREYESRYPDIILPIYETENQYSKHDGSLRDIMQKAVDSTGAKYIAFCEGDDYWTDTHKLQKQVDLMEARPHISICCHHVLCHHIETGKTDSDYFVCKEGEFSTADLAKENFIQTLSVMMRNDHRIFDTYQKIDSKVIGDYALWFCATLFGSIYKMPDKMAVYRLGSGSFSTLTAQKRHVLLLSLLNRLRCHTEDDETLVALDQQIAHVEMLISENRFSEEEYKIAQCLRKPRIKRELSIIRYGFKFLLRALFCK